MKRKMMGILALLFLVLGGTPAQAQDAQAVEDVIAVCIEEIGYTATKGGYSKYGDWAGGAYKEWCSEFISWCADQAQTRTGASIVDVVYPYHDTCAAGVTWYTNAGRYVTVKGTLDNGCDQWYWEDGVSLAERPYVPRRGDLVYIEWYKYNRIDHVAIVEYVTHNDEEGYVFHTIEGNNKILGPEPTQVARYRYALDDATIRGYGVLDGSIVGTTMKNGSEGDAVAMLQKELIAAGYLKEGNATGKFNDRTKEGVKAFQKAEGLKATGVADYETQKLLRERVPNVAAIEEEREEKLAQMGAGEAFFDSYDITDEAAVWEVLTRDITVLDVDANEKLYLRKSPDGPVLTNKEYSGYLYGQSVAVRVLGEEDGWTLIEGYNMRNELIRGYVRSRLIKTVSPNQEYGMVVDKMTQTLYMFKDGKLLTTLLISTGLPTGAKPYNETAQGEYLLISRTGGFWSGNMYCDLAIRFNGGDLLHLVPCLINGDGTRNFSPFEPQLGQRASHGCIRTQRIANEDGYNMEWIWDNIPMGTKILIWDDKTRPISYPAEDTPQYYNPEGGTMYHGEQNCSGVKKRWLPLTAFTYGELEDEPFKGFTACTKCKPLQRKSEIDAYNAAL